MSYLAEQKVIGSLLTSGDRLDEIISFLTPDMFHNEILKRAYIEFYHSYEKHETIDEAVLYQRIPDDNIPQAIVFQELVKAIEEVITTSECKHYAETLFDEYRAGRLNDILNSIRGQPKTIDQDIDKLIREVENLRKVDAGHLKTLSQIVEENKSNYFIDDGRPKILSGLKQLDDILGGFDGGDLVIIGARPAVGKSAFASQLALHFAQDLKLKVGYFNLEMQEKQIYERFVAGRSGIEVTRIRRATRFLQGEQEKFDEANNYLMKVKDIVISTGSKRISDIRTECRGQNFGIVIIDYLQLVKPDGQYRGNRYAEVGQISHAAKALAMDMNIPVIALCQLNRAVESRETKEPSMGDLRESGDFEQDASTILLLWNTNADDSSEKMIKVEKQRQGKNGRVKLSFDGNRMEFKEIPKGEEDVFLPLPDSLEF